MLRVLLMVLAVAGMAAEAHAQSTQQIQRGVEEALLDEEDLRRIEVSVVGNEVTLAGRVPTFLAKPEQHRNATAVTGRSTASIRHLPASLRK